MISKKGILLVNLGTPDTPQTPDVRKYLDEFLMDGRVIDINPLLRSLLVKGIIVPFRGPKSAKMYQKIWREEGSPLMVYSLRTVELLKERLDNEYHIELAMRYQNPSIATALNNLKAAKISSIKVIALFPQYASATTGSVHDKVMEIVRTWQNIPEISFVNSFYDHELLIEAFADKGRRYAHEDFDHVIFSFHGLPERQLIKADESGCHCLKTAGCCNRIVEENKYCYRAQCHSTARLIAEKLGIPAEKFTVSFQSKLGNAPWAKPYTVEVIHELAAVGAKKLLVFSPAFVADCLETVYEIGEEYQEEFKQLGGEHIQLVESLNDSSKWIDLIEDLIHEHALST